MVIYLTWLCLATHVPNLQVRWLHLEQPRFRDVRFRYVWGHLVVKWGSALEEKALHELENPMLVMIYEFRLYWTFLLRWYVKDLLVQNQLLELWLWWCKHCSRLIDLTFYCMNGQLSLCAIISLLYRIPSAYQHLTTGSSIQCPMGYITFLNPWIDYLRHRAEPNQNSAQYT